jgi:serine/threonine protein kinase
MAPEIRTALSYDPVKSDWWAFGVCVCELLSGWTPFDPDVEAPAAAAPQMHERARGGAAASIHRVDPFALERNALAMDADAALDRVARAVPPVVESREESPGGGADADAANAFAPFTFAPSARLLITRLLDIDPTTRMASAREVRTSSWFAGVRFDDLLSGRAPPPWVPAPGQRAGEGAAAARELALDEGEEKEYGGDGGAAAAETSDATTKFAQAWAWEARHFANWQA